MIIEEIKVVGPGVRLANPAGFARSTRPKKEETSLFLECYDSRVRNSNL